MRYVKRAYRFIVGEPPGYPDPQIATALLIIELFIIALLVLFAWCARVGV